jgi:hypothetical protein
MKSLRFLLILAIAARLVSVPGSAYAGGRGGMGHGGVAGSHPSIFLSSPSIAVSQPFVAPPFFAARSFFVPHQVLRSRFLGSAFLASPFFASPFRVPHGRGQFFGWGGWGAAEVPTGPQEVVTVPMFVEPPPKEAPVPDPKFVFPPAPTASHSTGSTTVIVQRGSQIEVQSFPAVAPSSAARVERRE